MLPKVKKSVKKRVGRGYGSGKGGHTAGRGQKGQKSRGDKIHILFEGYKSKKSLIKRLPFYRGKGKFKAAAKPVNFNLDQLNVFTAGSKVNPETLAKKFTSYTKEELYSRGVKILGRGKLTKKLTIEVPASASAQKKVEKVGGKVILEKK